MNNPYLTPNTVRSTVPSLVPDTVRSLVQSAGDSVIGIYPRKESEINKLSNEDDFVVRVDRFILKNISKEDFKASMLIEHFKMSRASFYAKFREKLHVGVMRYVSIVRMAYAAELLLSTSLRLSKIAEKVGYADPIYFSKVFKSMYKVAPRTYRCQFRTQIDNINTIKYNDLSRGQNMLAL